MKKERYKVLIIDDDPGIIKILEKWIENAGKNVISAKTGEDGFLIARENLPNLILLDLMLPGIGGVETAKLLYKQPETKDIPIIFITACLGVENDKGNEEMEIDGRKYKIFAKPLHSRKLLSEIRKAINRKENNNT